MGEAFLIKYGGGSGNGGSSGNTDITAGPIEGISGIIRIYTTVGATVRCKKKDSTGNWYSVLSSGTVDIPVKYGVWTIEATISDKTDTAEVIVSSTTIYEVNLRGHTYGIQIDCSVGSPNDAVSYIDDSVGFTPLMCSTSTGICSYGSWHSIINEWVKPCMWKNGERTVYLNPDNYAEDVDGNSVDITSGNSGDVMVEFAHRWYRYSIDGNILKFEVSDYDRSKEGFVDSAFLSEDGLSTHTDAFYWGAYEGWVTGSKLRSLSGKSVTVNISYETGMTNAGNNHSKCTIEPFIKLCYIWGLLMLVTRGRDLQATCGRGRVDGNSNGIATGTMNTKGLFFGDFTGKNGVKTFGIENMWGNYWKFIAGLVTMGNGAVGVKLCKPYAAAGTGYTSLNPNFTVNQSLYPTKFEPFLGGAIMLPTLGQSDSSVGWPDYFLVYSAAGLVPLVGGVWDNGSIAGPFYCYIYYSPTSTYTNSTVRLVAS